MPLHISIHGLWTSYDFPPQSNFPSALDVIENSYQIVQIMRISQVATSVRDTTRVLFASTHKLTQKISFVTVYVILEAYITNVSSTLKTYEEKIRFTGKIKR
mmetsp:Transcript_13681/g.17914  ORF Transcript_13681/g.17914 Transcript_13681/m.17914 type:complete len:102 (+) Transcript_13681:253-558(+)